MAVVQSDWACGGFRSGRGTGTNSACVLPRRADHDVLLGRQTPAFGDLQPGAVNGPGWVRVLKAGFLGAWRGT